MNKAYRLWQYPIDEKMVNYLLDFSGYNGEDILNKRVLNLCSGEGSILKEIYFRNIDEFYKTSNNIKGLSDSLKERIFGVEVDKVLVAKSIINLTDSLSQFGLDHGVNIVACDALKFNEKIFDYCFCVPPQELRIEPSNFKESVINRYKPPDFFYNYYSNFIKKGLDVLTKNGKLTIICPADFFCSEYFFDYFYKNVASVKLFFESKRFHFAGPIALVTFTKRKSNNRISVYSSQMTKNLTKKQLYNEILKEYTMFMLQANELSNNQAGECFVTKALPNPKLYHKIYAIKLNEIVELKETNNNDVVYYLQCRFSLKRLRYLTRGNIFFQLINNKCFSKLTRKKQMTIISNYLLYNNDIYEYDKI